MSYLSTFDAFDSFFNRRPSVYVISDSELAKYKERQLLAEIAQLETLIDGHMSSIAQLEKTISRLKDELPEIEGEREEKQAISEG